MQQSSVPNQPGVCSVAASPNDSKSKKKVALFTPIDLHATPRTIYIKLDASSTNPPRNNTTALAAPNATMFASDLTYIQTRRAQSPQRKTPTLELRDMTRRRGTNQAPRAADVQTHYTTARGDQSPVMHASQPCVPL